MKEKFICVKCSVDYSCMNEHKPSLDSEMEMGICQWMIDNEVVEIKFSAYPQYDIALPV